MLNKPVYSEPMFDDETIANIENQETLELIQALLRYTKKLETMVVDLRAEVNGLTPADKTAHMLISIATSMRCFMIIQVTPDSKRFLRKLRIK